MNKKKISNNVLDLDGLIKNVESEKKVNKIDVKINEINEKDLTNHINKENISGNVKD